ncbi:MAG: hypothetical protein JKX92_07405 [Porticoccaceae bacterium]|nr:hypothetical protein [Porticoccaceae bacterium]
MDTSGLCSFYKEDDDSPIAGPGLVICKSCVTRCVKILLGEIPLPKSPRIVKAGQSNCDFCAKAIDLCSPQFQKNDHTICPGCVNLCLCAYLSKEAGVEIKQPGVGVLYAF